MIHRIRHISLALAAVVAAIAASLAVGVAGASAKPKAPDKPAAICYFDGDEYSQGSVVQVKFWTYECGPDGNWHFAGVAWPSR